MCVQVCILEIAHICVCVDVRRDSSGRVLTHFAEGFSARALRERLQWDSRSHAGILSDFCLR